MKGYSNVASLARQAAPADTARRGRTLCACPADVDEPI
eukprot:CAMPEP_0181255860 /NCGR_PEP_ID=MMETSP1096-20121128/49396_1 /TAXON_ID=156174 ORGANISM="Chrysochromulina ericina, Strain CCMP281" /NCGR_SAMPLE_ID=MMETSP1096 /ASSEMBLY_ACC=CAM_ASM_000453 /LENGTH=37 /DNA_ID= /DNA_START= /DNA_END= /DNA_ORIENTATION=